MEDLWWSNIDKNSKWILEQLNRKTTQSLRVDVSGKSAKILEDRSGPIEHQAQASGTKNPGGIPIKGS